MKTPVFLSLVLVLTTVWMQLYASVREIYNGKREIVEKMHALSEAREAEAAQFAIERDQFLEFKQNVAAILPGLLPDKGLGEEGYALRNLASLVSKKDMEQVRQAIAKTLFEHGREQFRVKNYAKAIRSFHQFIQRYSYSVHVAEAYFLLAESHFQLDQREECTYVIQQMIELFPQHELTGFALVRLGRIYQAQNRNEEAVEIYKSVLRSFPQRDVASQAKASLKGIEL